MGRRIITAVNSFFWQHYGTVTAGVQAKCNAVLAKQPEFSEFELAVLARVLGQFVVEKGIPPEEAIHLVVHRGLMHKDFNFPFHEASILFGLSELCPRQIGCRQYLPQHRPDFNCDIMKLRATFECRHYHRYNHICRKGLDKEVSG